jgi:signal peptidase I
MDGDAMMPTIQPGARVTVNLGVALHRGDVVLLDLPTNHRSVRRIVALGGQGVQIYGGTAPPEVGISEAGSSIAYAYDEPYIDPTWTVDTSCCRADGRASGIPKLYRVPTGAVYVLGDDRNNIQDSRTFGALALDAIKGRVLADPRLPAQYPEPWHAAGSFLPTKAVLTSGGPSHCGLEAVTLLEVGWPIGTTATAATGRWYVRDPTGFYAPYAHLQGVLPTDARDTGFKAASVRLYFSPTDQDRYAYRVGPDRVERWPRQDPPAGCA